MRGRRLWIGFWCLAVAEALGIFLFAIRNSDSRQDAVQVNEALQSVREDWPAMEEHKNRTDLDYVVLDQEGTVVFRTEEGLSESLHAAVLHRDTILDIQADGRTVGKILIYNGREAAFQEWKRACVLFLCAAMGVQCAFLGGYLCCLNRTVLKPFQTLERFAQRVAGGNLDIPLPMDRRNVFGAFTESFDIMRAELKKARQAEAQANESKKELVAKLSHDIKTPVASIKAAAEVGEALAESPRLRENYAQIIRKADQINTLVTNLFTATLKELKQLAVAPLDRESGELKGLLDNADYLHRAVIPDIPDCMVYMDPLRLQQVFDNIFANSYKYAGTEIEVTVSRTGRSLTVTAEDYGGGVKEEEVFLLKEKFKRGSNAEGVEGAGLGLYIADYFMREMGGGLTVENGEKGLRVSVTVLLSGEI